MNQIDYAVRKDIDYLVDIDSVANMFYDEDFDTDSVSEYAWTYNDFVDFVHGDKHRRQIFAFYEKGLPSAFIAYTIREETKTFYIDKLESLKDDNEATRLEGLLWWLTAKVGDFNVCILVNEADLVKIKLLSAMAFKSELKRRAFDKVGRDGIAFTSTLKVDRIEQGNSHG